MTTPASAMPDNGDPIVFHTIAEFRHYVDHHRSQGCSVGYVPTMGYLHEGHASLMRAARNDNDIVVASIFVNPLQFAANEDLSTYPRDLEADRRLAGAAGVDAILAPSVEEMYPHGAILTTVRVNDVSDRLEGSTRPTHFAGVATVVSKLFFIVGPCRAYFGEKDFQQLAVIRRMVADLSIPVEVVGCPIVRESDGLAMSSRNVYLTEDQRPRATVLRQSLDEGLRLIAIGERNRHVVEDAMRSVINAEPAAVLDYVAVVDAATLEPLDELTGTIRLLVAATVGTPRLIDNDGVTIEATTTR